MVQPYQSWHIKGQALRPSIQKQNLSLKKLRTHIVPLT